MVTTHTTRKLLEGDSAPDFTLSAQDETIFSLSKLKGKHFVLYFYPKDDTPGCTIEAKDFARLNTEFQKAGAIVLGISKDTIASHKKFFQKYCLNFPLLSDTEGTTCQSYGVWVEKSMYGKKYMGIERTTFLIDAEGRVARIWPKVKVDGHAKDVLQAMQSA